MLRQFENITSENVQRHSVFFNDIEATVILKYCPQVQSWFFDCEIGSKAAYGIRLSCGTLHMVSRNMPIDFLVVDNTGQGVDPFLSNDFVSGRCSIVILDNESMEEIRGQEV